MLWAHKVVCVVGDSGQLLSELGDSNIFVDGPENFLQCCQGAVTSCLALKECLDDL